MDREKLEHLLHRAATGDARAFDRIVRRFQDMAVGYAFSLLRDFQLAEDAAQEAFLQAYQDLWQLRDPRAFPSWLRKLIFKHCDRLTRNKRLETVPLETAVSVGSPAPGVFEAVEMRAAYAWVYEALGALSEPERTVTTLFYIGERSHKEIAAFLDIPVTTVKKRLHDARKHLKERTLTMFQDSLQENRPSRDDQFVARVFRPGATMPREAVTYVERPADTALYDALRLGRLCCVLGSRQAGKSSLMVRTAARLRSDGIAGVLLDLTAVGLKATLEEWSRALLDVIGRQLDLGVDLATSWQSCTCEGAGDRLIAVIHDRVLPRLKGDAPRLIVFIDEIDFVRSLPFSVDVLFRAIGDADRKRVADGVAAPVAFCFLGVAAPADLVEDGRVGLFDTACEISLADFTEAEVRPLAHRLAPTAARGEELLRRILFWTGGHPYLTQTLCGAITEDPSVTGPAGVDRVCERWLFSSGCHNANLDFVRDLLLKGHIAGGNPLGLYGRVLRGERRAEDESAPLVTLLRAAGILRVVDGNLHVRNRIYERVFDTHWVEANLA